SSRPGVPSRLAGGAATSAAGHGGPGSDPLSEAGVPHLPEPAWLDWVGDVPDEVAQRLACDADVWRVVLDPARGQPVEVGRSHRLVPAWLRKALHARDRGCRFPGCGAPSAWSDAHHVVPWARGGRTDAGNLVLLCRWHHSLVHEGGWSVEIDGATGAVTVRRPGGRPFQPPFDPPPSRGP
ncbi:MAG TPA: HNH endonuclease signature motif containing protein, partial [Pilimelia sp.]|nr:HNH endonuclease signature motif containing protein [Pilimelia sp.]